MRGDRFLAALLLGMCWVGVPLARSESAAFTNSLGMQMARIEPGAFVMGSNDGESDEQPVHRVTITQPFFIGAVEVNNAQYEEFAPEHKALRAKRGISKEDGEAVVFVSWNDAARFCQWLSEKEGKPYRLPTEAEWEYACRAGTTTAYHTGEALPAEFQRENFAKISGDRWAPRPVNLAVGQMPANAWGLHEMHGNVEEWCWDWYGPYEPDPQIDPVGRASGDMKVSRGGSHNTEFFYLRSANRQGSLPDDKNWLIGFRVLMGELPKTQPLPPPPPEAWGRDVKQIKFDWPARVYHEKPFFADPVPFVIIPPKSNGPVYEDHNHCPSITWCDNGDLLAAWFSTSWKSGGEAGRCLSVVASRRRAGSNYWETASGFFLAPDRNLTGTALFNDGKGTLYHFNGLGAAGGWADLAFVLRTSHDNGATWSPPRLIDPEHRLRNQVISGTLMTKEGFIVQPCDATFAGDGGTAIHLSRDRGQTWIDPGAGTAKAKFTRGGTGGTIAGIHAGVVELGDGRLMAFGRGDTIQEKMPVSYASDLGQTWTYDASPWPPISGGQRLVLMRLREGPLLFVSFTDGDNDLKKCKGMGFMDAAGKESTGYGMFAALSFDDGATWPVRKLLTPPKPGEYKTRGHVSKFTADAAHAEPRGYLAATQSPDGVVQLVSSGLHYRFNLAWLKSPAAISK